MLVGEAQDLFSERAEKFGSGCLKKGYYFQARSEEGLDYFRDLSCFFPALSFVLETRMFKIEKDRGYDKKRSSRVGLNWDNVLDHQRQALAK